MSEPANLPDLVISLSHDRIGLFLAESENPDRKAWKSSFQVNGAFLEEQVSAALDTALLQNPFLLDQFETVDVLVIDRPNICIPQHYVNIGKTAEIASRYLRVRAGDMLTVDGVLHDRAIVYSVPSDTINVVKEYYSNADPLHLISVLWCAISQHDSIRSQERHRLFFHISGSTLMVLGMNGTKLTFSKNFAIRESPDILYFMHACRKLLRPLETWLVTIQNEEVRPDILRGPHSPFKHRLELPDLPTLVAQHRICAS